MGTAASSELKAAEASIRRLHTELRAVQALAVSKDEMLAEAAAELASARSSLAKNAKAAGPESSGADPIAFARLEEALRTTRKEAEAERIKYREVREELARARDRLAEQAGDAKFRSLEKASSKREQDQVLGSAAAAASLVAEANAVLGEGEANSHSIYGSLLGDLGHKKVYKANPRRLWTGTVLWEKQRAFRDDRAAMIAKAKLASSVGGWPGSISIVERGQSPAAVVDGQHRLGAAWLLGAQEGVPPALQEMVVDVYPAMDDAKIFALFAEINKCEPVSLVDMPADVVEGGASEADREAIDAVAVDLQRKYPDMFKPSRSCRPPHVNVDVLRAEIHKSGVLAKLQEPLATWIAQRNRDLANVSHDRWRRDKDLRCLGASKDAIDKALSKAVKHDFYLGLTWEWLLQHDRTFADP